VCCAVLGVGGVAQAERKRVVVLDFEGPRGAKFHEDLVKLLKKTHTVVPTDKWNGTAEELDASEVSENNVKKVAKKLKVDAIVEGKIEKRRAEFIIHLKLREGRSGALIGSSIDTKARGPRIDSRAQRELKDELVGAIGRVESNRLSGGDDDEDDRPVRKGFSSHADDERGSEKVDKKPARKLEDDDDALPAKKPAKKTDDAPVANKPATRVDDDDSLPPKKPAAKRADDDAPPARKAVARKSEDDDALPASKPANKSSDKRGRSKVASSDDDAEVDAEAGERAAPEVTLSPGERALDAVAGLSVTARQLTFTVRPGLVATPPIYKGAPVAGAMLDATIYPLAVGHKRSDLVKNIGLDVMYDRVISVSTKDSMGKIYASKETRFGIGGVFRYAFGRSAMAPVVMGTLGYSSQLFSISSGALLGIPSVKYSIVELGLAARFPITRKIIAGLDARRMLISGAGQIQDAAQYGDAKLYGYEVAAGFDYAITGNIFARAAFRYESIGYSFTGTGTLSNARDGDPMTKDVSSARDSYIGGIATLGLAY
jgi:opacity protein-like surface antigen